MYYYGDVFGVVNELDDGRLYCNFYRPVYQVTSDNKARALGALKGVAQGVGLFIVTNFLGKQIAKMKYNWYR